MSRVRYGTCQVCGNHRALRQDGNVRAHLGAQRVEGWCNGTGVRPVESATSDGHYFHFSVCVQAEDADRIGEEPFKLTVRAWSLQEACRKASEVKLPSWELPPEDDDE